MGLNTTSCATATLYRKESPMETWAWITSMFTNAGSDKKTATSFIPGGYDLTPVEHQPKGLKAGSVYRYHTMNTGPYYVTIKKAVENETLEYITELKPTHGEHMRIDKQNGVSMMRFTIEPHPEGTQLTVDRVEKVHTGTFDKLLGIFGIGFDKNTAVMRLVYILSNGADTLPSGSTYSKGNLHVARNDRLIKALAP